MIRIRSIAVLAGWLALAVPWAAHAQSQAANGNIEGIVRDTSGAVIPGVTVTVTNVETGTSRVVVTNNNGLYRALALPLGTYSLVAELQGFRKFEQSGLDALKAAGCEVFFEPDAAGETLVAAIKKTEAPALVVRSTQVTDTMMDAGALSLIVRAGAGVNTIDVAAASKRGIYVSNCPGKNSVAVAELTMGLILALDRRIPDNVADLRAGTWNKKEYSKAKGLMGQTLGLLGFGHIGREVAKRARAFGMPVVVWSRRYVTDQAARESASEEFGIEIVNTPSELMAKSDIVSVHLALTRETRAFVNAELLSHAKNGAFIINTARAECVDQAALRAAIRERQLRVGLDVFVSEPSTPTGDFADPIVQEPGVYGTHHIGASTDQAQEAIAAETVRIVRTFKDTGKAPNSVNV